MSSSRTDVSVRRPVPRRRPTASRLPRPARGDRHDESSPSALGLLTGVVAGLTLAQCARILLGLLWLGWANVWASDVPAPTGPLLAAILTAAGVGILAAAVLVRSEEGTRRLDKFLLASTVAMLAMLSVAIGTISGYGTDELAYDQSAASAVLHGVNPYTTDFAPVLHTFGVWGGGTMTLRGTVVPSIAYPSLSFLLYVPFVALMGPTSYAGFLVDLIAWFVAGVVLWRLMSPALRPWVPLVLAVPVMYSAIVGGMTDSLFLPFEIIAVCCWDRFAAPGERSVARWIGPVALGLACCIKQPPWLIAPFLLIGVGVEAHRRGQDWRHVSARYVAIAAAAFLVPNIPFIVWNPSAWISRILLPLTGGLVPMGIGPVGLLRAFGIGGGNLSLFGLASVAAMVTMLLLYVRHYPRWTRIIPLLPLAMLFVSSRNLGTYFAFCVPALAINAGSIRTSTQQLVSARAGSWLTRTAVVAASACAALLMGALLWPAPAQLAVRASGETSSTLTATVVLTNISDHAVAPHFILATGSFYQQGMTIASGPSEVPPHGSATIEVSTPVGPLTPHSGATFQVEVGTVSPDTFAASAESTVGQPSA